MKWRNPFRRARPTPPTREPLNEDWRVGDLAVRIGSEAWDGDGAGPAEGETLRVVRIKLGQGKCNRRSWGLGFATYPDLYHANAFRKITPNHEAAEDEFTALIRKMRPARKPVSA